MTIPLQPSIVYGPLESRRFGKSLGINLLPATNKICSFDCVYCQYGKTDREETVSFPKANEIEAAVKEAMREWQGLGGPIDWIMFSGNGEPTLHPDFQQIARLVVGLRDAYLPGIPIGILSNSATCYRPEIRDTLLKLDGRFMKLDAGTSKTFDLINRPFNHTFWKEIIGGLYQIRHVVLQSMFVAGSIDNTAADEVDEWIKAVQYIQPEAVQVYTVERPTAHEGLLPVPKDKLQNIADLMTVRTQIPARVFD